MVGGAVGTDSNRCSNVASRRGARGCACEGDRGGGRGGRGCTSEGGRPRGGSETRALLLKP